MYDRAGAGECPAARGLGWLPGALTRGGRGPGSAACTTCRGGWGPAAAWTRPFLRRRLDKLGRRSAKKGHECSAAAADPVPRRTRADTERPSQAARCVSCQMLNRGSRSRSHVRWNRQAPSPSQVVIRVPNTARNCANQAGWAGQAGAVTKMPSVTASSTLIEAYSAPANLTSAAQAG